MSYRASAIWTSVGAFVFIATSCWDGDFCHSYSASSYYYYYYYYLLLFRPCLKCSSMVVTKVKGTVTKLRKASISKDCLNRCVLSLCLNNSMDPASLTLSGRWFHKLGPLTAKERSPNKTVLEGGWMTRWRCDDDLRHHLETLTQ